MIMSLKQMKLNHNIYIEFYDVIAGKMCRITFKFTEVSTLRGTRWQAPVWFFG